MADYAVKTMKDLGLIGNGPNKTLGNMQTERVKRMVDILTPIFAAQRKPVKDGPQGRGAVHQRVHRPRHRADVAVSPQSGAPSPAPRRRRARTGRTGWSGPGTC